MGHDADLSMSKSEDCSSQGVLEYSSIGSALSHSCIRVAACCRQLNEDISRAQIRDGEVLRWRTLRPTQVTSVAADLIWNSGHGSCIPRYAHSEYWVYLASPYSPGF